MIGFPELLEMVAQLPEVPGISPASALDLPAPLVRLFQRMFRQGQMTPNDIATLMNLEVAQARVLSDGLAAKGYIVRHVDLSTEAVTYGVAFARIRQRHIPDL